MGLADKEDAMADTLGRGLPVLPRTTAVIDAARVIVDGGLHGVIVAGRDGAPRYAIPAGDVLRLFVPEYIVEDPTLARVYDPEGAREVLAKMAPRTLDELLHDDEPAVREIAVIPADATPMEIAAELIRARTTVAWVRDSRPARFVTVADLLAAMVAHAPGA
jgi:hypothetical protein